MSVSANALVPAVQQQAAAPPMGRRTGRQSPQPYRVIAVSLFDREASLADHITAALQNAGWPKANRSLVIREAILLLTEQLGTKSDDEVFRYFVNRYALRAGQLPSSHS